MTLIERLKAAKTGSRELSDECLLAVGWTQNQITPGNVRYKKERPDPSQNLQDALDWLRDRDKFPICIIQDMGPVMGVSARVAVIDTSGDTPEPIAYDGKADTPALALCAASLRALEAMKENTND